MLRMTWVALLVSATVLSANGTARAVDPTIG